MSCEGRGGEGREEGGEDSEAEAARPTHPWCHQPTYSMRGHNLAAPHREEDEDNREKDPQQILAKDIAGELVEVLVSWRRRRGRGRGRRRRGRGRGRRRRGRGRGRRRRGRGRGRRRRWRRRRGRRYMSCSTDHTTHTHNTP